VVRIFEQRLKIDLAEGGFGDGDVRVGDQHLHAHRRGERRQGTADRAIADDPDRAAAELSPHPRDRDAAGLVGSGRA